MERLFITELQIMNVRHLKDICIPLSTLNLNRKKWKWQDKCFRIFKSVFYE